MERLGVEAERVTSARGPRIRRDDYAQVNVPARHVLEQHCPGLVVEQVAPVGRQQTVGDPAMRARHTALALQQSPTVVQSPPSARQQTPPLHAPWQHGSDALHIRPSRAHVQVPATQRSAGSPGHGGPPQQGDPRTPQRSHDPATHWSVATSHIAPAQHG